jgi:hypothetical protein
MKSVSYTVVTNNGRAFDVSLPLHLQTRSETGVAQMVTELLATLSSYLGSNRNVSDGDVLQALAITLAIRARMLSATQESTASLIEDLFGTAYAAARAAPPYIVGRA